MKQPYTCRRLMELDEAIAALAASASAEGFPFMATLIDEWERGLNRFDQPGEAYFTLWRNGLMVAAGGLNRDPYLDDPTVGRVRHVYVMPAVRRSAAGRTLLHAITAEANRSFSTLRLRTRTTEGAAFYEALGFDRCNDPMATHVLSLQTLAPEAISGSAP